MPIVVAYSFNTDRLLPKKILLLLAMLISIIFLSHSYIRLPVEIKAFEDNKVVFSGRVCGFKMERHAYLLCIEGEEFRSDGTSQDLRSDAIANFNWLGRIDMPKGCIEIEYLNYGEMPAEARHPRYRAVAIGRLREIFCKN